MTRTAQRETQAARLDRLLRSLDDWRKHTTDGELVTAVSLNLTQFCIRCRGDIEPGLPAVYNPAGIWLHVECAVPPLAPVADLPDDADAIPNPAQLALDLRPALRVVPSHDHKALAETRRFDVELARKLRDR